MTVQSIDPQVIYDGDAVTRVFPFGFDMAAESTLRVSFVSLGLVVTVVPPEDYSVARFAQGGEVTFNLAPPADVKVVLTRRTPFTQQVSVTAQTAYDPRVVESVWDKLTVVSQELAMAQQTMLRGAPGTDPTTIYSDVMQAAEDAGVNAGIALAAKNDAENARDASQTAQGLAEGARDAAVIARGGAESARGTANSHATNAQTFRNQAQAAQNAAAISAGNASSSASSASNAAIATAADRVQTGLDKAATAADRVQTGLDRAATTADRAAAEALANGMPLGTIMHFAADTPPSGWLVCDGSAVTALYPDLRAFLLDAGSPYGLSGADPLLPDLRGEFVRGWDGGRGVDAGRVFGSAQGDVVQDHSHLSGVPVANTTSNVNENARFGTVPMVGTTTTNRGGGGTGAVSMAVTSGVIEGAEITLAPAASRPADYAAVPSASVGTETRPRNIALLPCIRAYASVVNVPGQADLDNILQQVVQKSDYASEAEALAGTATDKVMSPARVREAAVQATAEQALGVGQGWVDVLGSRVKNITYQNTTGRAIAVSIFGGAGQGVASLPFEVSVDGANWVKLGEVLGSYWLGMCATIPAGYYYRIRGTGGGSVMSWAELR